MPTRRALSWTAVALLVVALAGAWSCSKSSNPTAPGGGGGAKELSSGDLGTGASYQHRFFVAGSFPYHCTHHPTVMTGTVTVSASAADTVVAIDINAVAPFPAASVKPGGRVVWTNNTVMLHTVTSD
jgi:plastocyanin